MVAEWHCAVYNSKKQNGMAWHTGFKKVQISVMLNHISGCL